MRLRQPIGGIRAGEHLKLVDAALAGQHARVRIADERLSAEPDVLLRHQFRRRLVHEMRVLDALRPRGDGPLHGLGRIGVNRDIGVPIARRLNACAQLRFAEGRHVERRARGRHAAAADELDLRRALEQLLAHAQAHLVRAVCDHRAAGFLHRAQRSAGAARDVLQRAQVAVSAAGRDHRAAGIDARPQHEALVDRLLEREGRTAEIADRGEAAHQRALGLVAGGNEDIADVGGKQARDR